MSEANLFENGDEPKRKKRAERIYREKPQLPAVQQPATLVEVIARIASDPAVDTDKMRAIIEIQRETEAKQQFHDAMIQMDGELPKINRDGKISVKGGVLRFAKFETINNIIKPILRKHGFRLNFQPDVPQSGQGIIVHCHLTRGLYSESCTVPVPASSASPAMNAQQAVGAALSYAKRYGVIALLNLETEAPEDRDTDARPPSEGKKINEKQAEAALNAFNECGAPSSALTKWLPEGSTDVHDMLASDYKPFMEACTAFKVRMKGAKR